VQRGGALGELRTWYGHDPTRFDAFATRYRAELEAPERAAAFASLQARRRRQSVTLLTATKALELSHAVVADLLSGPA
jgi:uncharacterized protein YeaO (DUF488 family)